MPKRHKFAVAMALITITLGYLVYAGVKDSFVYYLTIDEMLERVPGVYEDKIRVAGSVVPGSIKKNADGAMEFTITDGANNVDVRYKGIVPDVFADNVQAIVEGRYTRDRVFEADLLLAKCPTKYKSTGGIETRGEYPQSAPYNYRGKSYFLKDDNHGGGEGL